MYRIIREGRSDITEKKSRFLGFAIPVGNDGEAMEHIASIRKKHYDARHVCYAYQTAGMTRSSDDGEPQGTAGRPILDVITHSGVDGILVAVVRYFGGVLLGTGGLVRAYQQAASDAVDSAELVEMKTGYPMKVTLDYNDYGRADYFFNEKMIPRISTEYDAGVTLKLIVPEEYQSMVDKKIAEITAGKSSCEWEDAVTYGIVDKKPVEFGSKIN